MTEIKVGDTVQILTPCEFLRAEYSYQGNHDIGDHVIVSDSYNIDSEFKSVDEKFKDCCWIPLRHVQLVEASKPFDWILDMVRAGLEGETIMYGDDRSTTFLDVIRQLSYGLDSQSTYSILDSKQEIKDLEEEL